MDFLHTKTNPAQPLKMLIGKVVENYNDNYKGMLKVEIYSYNESAKITDWMRVVSPNAGKNRGFCFLPEIGDEVLVAFIDNDINNPCVLGSFWNEKNTCPPDTLTKENTVKSIITKSGNQIYFSDESGKENIQITTPNKLTVKLDDSSEKIEITDKNANNKIIINSRTGSIVLSSSNTLELKSKRVSISASEKVSIESAQAEIKGNSSLKLQSAGLAELKGMMVKING